MRKSIVSVFLVAAVSLSVSATSLASAISDAIPSQAQSSQVNEAEYQQPSIDRSQSNDKVLGGWLFNGNFAKKGFTGFNPNYLINVGDTILLKLWGAVDIEMPLVVDPQGNIFVPRVGPVHVLNVRNEDLNKLVGDKIRTIYRENVGVYASLAQAQLVKVFVTGNVTNPGLYEGFSADSALHFLDRAGGIAGDRGSFLDIRLIRNGKTHKSINLYEFLFKGYMPNIQYRDGDTLFVSALLNTVTFEGLVQNPYQLEFVSDVLRLDDALGLVGVMPTATHVRVTRNQGSERNVEYFSVDDSHKVLLQSGDQVNVLADKTVGSILVQVEGEHIGLTEYVLPYGAKLGDLVSRIQLSDRSKIDSIQLYRKSLADRQKYMLEQTLRALETEVLSARSETIGEAGLRTQEAQLILQFIERAKSVSPRGQVVLTNTKDKLNVALEDGDVIRVPKVSHLITVHGEVYFPSAFLYESQVTPKQYIEKAGGFSQKANKSRVLVMHQNGVVERHQPNAFFASGKTLKPGDEILVMPEVDFKSFQFTKDIVEVIYQIAISAGVLLSI